MNFKVFLKKTNGNIELNGNLIFNRLEPNC